MCKIKRTLLTLLIVSFAFLVNAKEYNIIEWGAVSDTTRLSSSAIQKAIDICSEQGGGKVIIPSGNYKIGTIILKSNVCLFFEPGATLWGSTNIKDYINLKPGFISLRTQEATKQLIYAEKAENISLTGFGTINGQGKIFKKLSWNDEGITRPHLIRFIQCQNITLENITLKNSGCWMQHYLACKNLNIRGIHVYNHNNFNNDALDLDGCKNVTVSDFISDSDDDGITLKSTSGELCENIAINNCIISSHCNAIKMGTESNGGFKNITISNCVVKPSEKNDTVFFGTLNGTSGLSLEIVDGGIMQGITVSNLNIEGTESPIFIRLANRARPYKKDAQINTIGKLGDVLISNVFIKNAKSYGCSITGLPGHPVENIKLSNIIFQQDGGKSVNDYSTEIPEKEKDYPDATMFGTLPAYGFFIRHAQNITMDNCKFTFSKEDSRPAIYMDDVAFATLSNVQLQSSSITESNIVLKQSRNILIQSCSLQGKSNCFLSAGCDDLNSISLLNNYLPEVKNIYQAKNATKGNKVNVR